METKEILDDLALARICEICRLKLNEKESDSIKNDCNSVLTYFSQIQKISQSKEGQFNSHTFGSGASDLRNDQASKSENAESIRSQFAQQFPNGLMKAPKNL